MTWVDGQGYKHFGIRGLLLTDSIASILAGALLLYFLGSRLKKPSSDRDTPVVLEAKLP
jgi:hypothetical protein